ncbi:EPIDERMAL PATTERNING FACTOR-like protein 2 [Apium graveolens]|uniref:EPIDERMAL PATTERNING FACTOR-like protein 2 n=1 Tax=Apium graveolens TaxID=4045 RepID=UPI003D78F38F
MAPASAFKSYKLVLLTIILIFPVSHLLSKSVEASGSGEANQMVQHKKKILGSRPPACVNKCLSCRPCMATLVMPPHHTKSKTATTTNFKTSKKYSGDEDDTYYLLSWKCKCGNKVYQP